MGFLSKENIGTIFAIVSGLCYGFIGYFGVTIVKSGLSIYNMLFLRFLIATIIILVIALLRSEITLKQYKANLKILFYGLTFYGISAIIYFVASIKIGTGLSMVIFFIYPAIVMLLNVIFYKAKISRLYYFAFSLIILGLLFMVNLGEAKFDILGIIFAILSAILYAFYVLESKKMEISPIMSTLMVSLGCMISCYIASYIDSSLFIPNNMNIWFNLVCMAIFCTVIPILLLLESLKYISSEKASILSVLEPLFVFMFGISFLGEEVNHMQIIGTVILLSGALLSLAPETKSKKYEV